MPRRFLLAFFSVVLLAVPALAEAPKPLKILFLGDNGHHRPADRFRQLQPVMAARGIDITYTDKADALNPKTLAGYDGLIIYANTTNITPDQEKALLDYVQGGKGFIPLHCASYCFLNSPKYIDLVGAQFKSHQTGTFGTTIAEPDHPVMKGFKGFESWDETYVHTKHNEKDRTVLEYRKEGDKKEPWTWVRTEGKGRVFYTAWGHDERTWGNPGFQNLVERGIRWAVGGDPAVAGPFPPKKVEMTRVAKDVKPFEYKEANVPFYPPGGRGAGREGLKTMQLPLDPAESMKHIVHPDDLDLRQFATEEQLGGKPICMNWDERGRLWVAVTMDYPNEMQPEGKGRDRIIILEDTRGTGHADKVTLFADKLSIPTSLVFAFGGVIVHQPPHTLFLKDTDGDDHADVRQVLFTGWGTGDTHAGPSNLRYGLDGWYYGIVGYSGFYGTVAGEWFRFSQGFYRFKVEKDGEDRVKVTKMEFLRNTSNNSWGVGFSEEGLLFGSTANGCPSVYVPIPNRYYESVRGWSSTVLQSIAASNRFQPITDKIRQVDYHGGFTAGAGHALYTARTYPREYWNRTAFVSDPTGHLTATFKLQPKGTDFTASYGWNLVASDDEWCAPTMAEVGPDGNVWVIDWYAYIVQHNPTPPGFKTGKGGAYETELRDKKHGRIYRLVAKGAGEPAGSSRRDKPGGSPVSLKGATPEKLVEALKSDNMFWRLHAQRLLIERGKTDVVPALVKLTADPAVDAVGLNGGATHALRTLHGLGALDGSNAEATAAAVAAVKHASAGVRRNALAVLPRKESAAASLIGSGALKDPDAQVRLEALLALAEMPPDPKAGPAILEALLRPENLDDRWIPHAAVSAAAAHDVSFLKAVAAAKTAPAARALTAIGIVAEHYGRGAPADTAGTVVAALADAPAPVAETVLGGMAKGWPRGKTAQLTDDTEKAMARLLARLSPGGKGSLIKLATTWGSKGFDKYAAETTASLLAVVGDAKASDADRTAAARQLAEFRSNDEQVVEKLLALVTPRTSPELTAGLLDALSASQAANVGPAVLKELPGWSPSARAAGLRVLLARPDTTRILLDAFDKGTVQLSELSLDQKQALAAHPDRQIAARAKRVMERGGGLPSADRQKVIDQLLALTKKSGDAAAGKAVFTKHCATCHMHSGEGNKVGPDLTGMAVHPKEHLLVDIIDPSRSVEGNYRVYTVETKDGRVLSGLLASETKTSVELIDAQAKRIVLQRDNIDDLKASTKSLMPEGFEKQITEAELTNLLEFLTQRGKYLPLPMEKAATVVSTKSMFYGQDARERIVFSDWSPKTFDGVPFVLVDPKGDKVPNVIMLNSSNGTIPPKMPKSVTLPCNSAAKAIHFLSGISGWGFPYSEKGSVSMIVRLKYEDGKTEDHELKNGEQFADYISRQDVPGSKFAFTVRSQQVRYLVVTPKREEKIKEIELVKGPDATAPVVVAVTVETR
jgi:putative membrane-bound dehydrogenase-like protein